MICENCLYEKNCQFLLKHKNKEVEGCTAFEDKSEWVHLPCKNGDVLIRNGIRCKVDHWNVIATAFTEDEKCRLFGLEEAEKALEDMRKDVSRNDT